MRGWMDGWVAPELTVQLGYSNITLWRERGLMVGLSSWSGLLCEEGATALSGARVSHHIMDYAVAELNPDKL